MLKNKNSFLLLFVFVIIFASLLITGCTSEYEVSTEEIKILTREEFEKKYLD